MAGFHRTVHPSAQISWAKLKVLAPDVGAKRRGDGSDEEPMGLAFVDPDGETHIYVFTEEGRQNLLKQLTGGLVVPRGHVERPGARR